MWFTEDKLPQIFCESTRLSATAQIRHPQGYYIVKDINCGNIVQLLPSLTLLLTVALLVSIAELHIVATVR